MYFWQVGKLQEIEFSVFSNEKKNELFDLGKFSDKGRKCDTFFVLYSQTQKRIFDEYLTLSWSRLRNS